MVIFSRAGRDGFPSRCILLYRFQDILKVAGLACVDANHEANMMVI